MRRIIALLLLGPWMARAAAVDHDPRPLTAQEQAVFMPLVCGGAVKLTPGMAPYTGDVRPYTDRCAKLIGYEDNVYNSDRLARGNYKDIGLSAIAYGSFSQSGADEAYVSYDGFFASHAELGGGGMLFRRDHGTWRLVGWFEAERRANCVGLPGEGKQEMLCLEGDGHADSSFEDIAPTLTAQNLNGQRGTFGWVDEYQTVHRLARPVLAMRDNSFQDCADRKANPYHIVDPREPCSGRPEDVGFLIEITGFKRSHRPGALAEAAVVYASPADVSRACRATCYLDARQQQGVIVFSLQGTRILVTMPGGFNLQSAISQ